MKNPAYITDPVADALTIDFMTNAGAKMPFHQVLAALSDQVLEADKLVYVNEPIYCSPQEMQRGFQFFEQYGSLCLFLLGHYSLPYCYASAEGARVLYFSEKIRNNTRQRLIDTAAFVLQVMQAKSLPEGGFNKTTATIRMRHALIRYFIGHKGGIQQNTHPPIHQHEMAGTGLAFSLLVIRGLHKLGIHPDAALENGFLKLWNEISVRLGVIAELLPVDLAQARKLETAIRKQHFAPSDEGLALLHSLIAVLEADPLMPGVPPAEILSFFMDKEVREILNLRKELPTYRKVWLKTALLAQHYYAKGTKPYPLYSIEKAFRSV